MTTRPRPRVPFDNASDTKGSGGPSDKQLSNAGSRYETRKLNHGLKPKDLCMMPARVAMALQADGWFLRQDDGKYL